MIDECKLIEDLQLLLSREDEMCKQAAELDFSGDAFLYSNRADCYRQVIKIISEQPKIDRWIPCSERLPKWGADIISSTIKERWYIYGNIFKRRKV